jgi:hypothetical protein
VKKEEYWRLEKGDVIQYHGRNYVVTDIEYVWQPESGNRNAVPYTVTLDTGHNLKPFDATVPAIQIVRMKNPLPARHVNRLEIVITGIDHDSKKWMFLEEAISSAIVDYGGDVTEWNVEVGEQ